MNGNYNEIAKQDIEAANVYKLKEVENKSYTQISKALRISSSLAKQLYKRACFILENPDHVWLDGLSRRARLAVLRGKFSDIKQLSSALMSGKRIEGVGDKMKAEIEKWVASKVI